MGNSMFPTFPMTCPLPYTLLCALCLSPRPEDRPDFEMVSDALQGIKAQAMKGLMLPGPLNTPRSK